MKLYEILVSREEQGGTQYMYAYCNAQNKKAAIQKIKEKCPRIRISDNVQIYRLSNPEIGEKVKLWYFDANNYEHAEFY